MDQAFVLQSPHRINQIDPRVKLLHTVLAGIMLFFVKSDSGVFLNLAFMTAVLLFFGLYTCAMKMVTTSLVLYILGILLASFGGFLAGVAGITIYVLFKFTPVMGIYFMMTQSVSASELVNALEKMYLPRAVTITLAVTLRFLPTIGLEMATIRDSMKIRNIPLTLWNVLKAPVTMLEYVLVPMMMRFVKVGEELAAAAMVRGIEYPGKRGSLYEIHFRLQDAVYLLLVIAFYGFLLFWERGM